ASRLSGGTLSGLRAIVGAANGRDDRYERAAHARGKSYHDLIHLRAGNLSDAPDALVYPNTPDEVGRILQWAKAEEIPGHPFAGGSSVVGGVTGTRGACTAAIALDLTLMNKLRVVDMISHTATAEAGIYGVDLEAQLNAQGYKHGHHPQSFEFSTLGGWIAA